MRGTIGLEREKGMIRGVGRKRRCGVEKTWGYIIHWLSLIIKTVV